MTDHIAEFMDLIIGIDVRESDDQDILELSDVIEERYGTIIDHTECESLYAYWNELNQECWTVCVFEPNLSTFNAYRGESDQQYRAYHQVMTAAEVLGRKPYDYQIEEQDLINLFEGD